MKRGVRTCTYKNTFWSKKRVEYDIKLKDIAEAIGVPITTVGMYFTGAYMPKESIVVAICNLFDVDFETGWDEFRKAHEEYRAERKRSLVAMVGRDIENKPDVCMGVSEGTDISGEDKINAIKELLYGRISYSVFCELAQMRIDKIEETVYGKVDYATYKNIECILRGEPIRFKSNETEL